MLRKIGNKLERLEEDIFEGRSEEVVRDISTSKQEIINFRKIIRPQRAVLSDLERTKQRYLAEDLEVYFDDIVDASERIWDMLENYKEVVEALEGTNESVLSHRVNEVLRVLTAFSVVVLPLTLIASIWGMNVGVPWGGDPSTSSTTTFWRGRSAGQASPVRASSRRSASSPRTTACLACPYAERPCPAAASASRP
jgi:magnesium transporter